MLIVQGAPLNESDHCGDPPLLLAAGNGMEEQRKMEGQKLQRLCSGFSAAAVLLTVHVMQSMEN
jgi:hypothetical protein